MILVGDLNVAPFEHDVWSHKQMIARSSRTHPWNARKLVAVQKAGSWVDAMRMLVPEPAKLYHLVELSRARLGRVPTRVAGSTTSGLRQRSQTVSAKLSVLKHSRGWLRPSDHVPVTATLEL